MAEVILKDVVKYYGSTLAVDRVNLTIADGELMVFVGPSGCGKSTTLRMVAGLETTTDGSIFIGERDVTRLEPKERNVAMVFQNYALYAHKNVYDNLGFGLRVRKTSKAEIDLRVRNAADMLGISELLHRKPKQLSGGQMQRVALGRALVRDPDVFLLDEPLSNLDAKMRVHMREEIAKLHVKTRRSMIYVTHDQVEAMTLGDRIAVMSNGQVQQVGPPLELYDQPVNVFVASFIGSPEMNLMNGILDDKDGSLTIQCGEISVVAPTGLQERPSFGKTLTVGMRPEHLSISSNENDSFPVEIELVEQMGAHTLVVCRSESQSLRALLNRNDQVRANDIVRLCIDQKNLHLFDPESGRSLLSGRTNTAPV